MTRRIAPLTLTALLALSMVGAIVPAGAQELGAPFLTIDAAPADGAVAVDERFTGTEFDNTTPVAAGAVGSAPVFVSDDAYGCVWATAISSGIEDWIGVARRGLADPTATPDTAERCPAFQTKVTAATAAGADALIVVNHSPGSEAGLAAGEIPAMMIGKAEGDRLIESLDPASPDAVKATLESLDPNTFLPPSPVQATSVSSLNASGGSGSVSVTGRAFFGGDVAVVAEDPAGDVPFPPALGLDIVEARIGQPDSVSGDLAFELRLDDLPATGGIPEHVRYTWDFSVDTGAGEPTSFAIDGKFTDAIRRQSQNTPAFFLQGNCVSADNVLTCEDVAELATVMDGALNRITATVPKTVLEEDIGGSIEGATVGAADICEGISTKIAAYFTLCGGAGESTGDIALQEGTYEVATPAVDLGIVPAGSEPAFTDEATMGSGGNFSGTLDTSGLAPGTYDVHARACFGSNCATRTTSITI